MTHDNQIFFTDNTPDVDPAVLSSHKTVDRIAAEFTSFLDAWHAAPEVYDDVLDAWIHEIYAKSLRGKPIFPTRGIPYFSPSSASSCRRELYEKIRGAAKDDRTSQPHQGRWTRIGTAIGDIIQRDVLFAEKHMKPAPRFTFERNDDNTPVFEDFAKKSHVITHNGKRFALFGACDGIMKYVNADGEIVRIGLEVKSKQTTSAQTSDYSTRNGPKVGHVQQVTAYGIMYDVDYYIILYVNASKKAWSMTPEEYAKSPDVKAFGIEITPIMKTTLLDEFASIVEAVETDTPPLMDIEKFTFNNFKRACALSLTEMEVVNLRAYAEAVGKSSLPDWQKREPLSAMAYITEVRLEKTG